MILPDLTVSFSDSTNAEVKTYIQTFWLPDANDADIDALMKLYSADITQGSPYDTGIFDALSPQFKRIASFQGDVVFQAARRLFLQQTSGKQNTWSFGEWGINSVLESFISLLCTVSKRLKVVPALGSVFCCLDLRLCDY